MNAMAQKACALSQTESNSNGKSWAVLAGPRSCTIGNSREKQPFDVSNAMYSNAACGSNLWKVMCGYIDPGTL